MTNMGIIVAVVYEQDKILLRYQDIMLILCLRVAPLQNLGSKTFIHLFKEQIVPSYIVDYIYVIIGI